MLSHRYFSRLSVLATLGFLSMGGAGFSQQLDLPPRKPGALSGDLAASLMTNLSRADRENEIYNQVAQGNIPDFLRNLVPVTGTSGGVSVVYRVTPDYLALGSNADYFLMPMSPLLAQWIADLTHTRMPTPKMVNQIHLLAPLNMTPSTIPPSGAMVTIPVFTDHNNTVRGQRNAQLGTYPLGTLVGGHKKDVVLTIRLATEPAQVAIYGWHYPDETFIQPLYLGHENTYADYSHGIRLVQEAVTVSGNPSTLGAVLANATNAPAISGEIPATFTQPYYIAPAAPELGPFSDSFPQAGRQLTSWKNRFKTHAVGAFSPTAPGGDGYVLTVMDTSGGIDTTRIGYQLDGDYAVEAYIYCEYRPQLASDGYERVGIFARDDGNGMFEGSNQAGTIKGSNYSLSWDSQDGHVHCLKTVAGVRTDLGPVLTRTGSQWRKFRMVLNGSRIEYQFDGETILVVNDTTFARGSAGIGYHENYATNANIRGTRADRFLLTTELGIENWVLY